MICIFPLIAPVNAVPILQNTNSITNSVKLYEYSEGIDIARSTGKPIAISMLNSNYDFQKTKAEMDKIININPLTTTGTVSWVHEIVFMNRAFDFLPNRTIILILDSDGKEIVRIVQHDVQGRADIDLTRLDSDRKVIGKIFLEYPLNMDKVDTFYAETFKYAETKKGKVQRLPQEKGLVSIKDLTADHNKYATNTLNRYNSNYYGHFVTISGLIRDIKSADGAYSFGIDDGTGVINLRYDGSLGDIKERDKIFVKTLVTKNYYMVITVSKNSITALDNSPKSYETNTAEPIEGSSSSQTPGFGALIGMTCIFLAWKKMICK